MCKAIPRFNGNFQLKNEPQELCQGIYREDRALLESCLHSSIFSEEAARVQDLCTSSAESRIGAAEGFYHGIFPVSNIILT